MSNPSLTAISKNHYKIEGAFGNRHIQGAQIKDRVIFNDESFYIKLDKRNDDVSDYFFNQAYPSVHDAVTSIVARNIRNLSIQTIDYRLATFEVDGEVITGTISRQFLKDGEYEQVLSRDYGASHTQAMSLIDDTSYKRALHTGGLKDLLEETLDDSVIKQLKEQSAFDILTNNRDRRDNPANVTFRVKDDDIKLVNFDFGRCFSSDGWAIVNEKLFNKNRLDTYGSQYLREYAPANNLFDERECLHVFDIDIDNLKYELDEFVNDLQEMNVPFKNYARVVADAAMKQIERCQHLVNNISLRSSLEDLGNNLVV